MLGVLIYLEAAGGAASCDILSQAHGTSFYGGNFARADMTDMARLEWSVSTTCMSRFGNIVLVLGSHAFARRARSMLRKLEYKS